jgi:hypothetical protein
MRLMGVEPVLRTGSPWRASAKTRPEDGFHPFRGAALPWRWTAQRDEFA